MDVNLKHKVSERVREYLDSEFVTVLREYCLLKGICEVRGKRVIRKSGKPENEEGNSLTMTIISIEGASAAGKTTTSAALATQTGAFHIPEVAAWWKKPKQEYPEWFFERQIDRWRIATEKEQDGLIVIDIDLYQPFWYNWAFDFTLFDRQTWESLISILYSILMKQV